VSRAVDAGAVPERARKVEELLKRRDELLLSNVGWAALTDGAVNYQTIRRMESGQHLPRGRTLNALEGALARARDERGEGDGGG
jgi:predicted transcriptional regulator